MIACKDKAVCIVSDDDMLITMRIAEGNLILSFECQEFRMQRMLNCKMAHKKKQCRLDTLD